MMVAALFFLGAIFGSFLDVVAMRYHPDRSLFSLTAIGGRSQCAKCGTTLRWFELVPIASFLLQLGRCRSCGTRINRENLLIEVVSGAIFAAVPAMVSYGGIYLHGPLFITVFLSTIWILAFWFLLLVTLIDLRWQIIPDEANVIFVILGIALALFDSRFGLAPYNSFLGPYGFLFGNGTGIWLNVALGFVVGAFLFGVLVLATRGRGMGMGDLKLAAALGVLFRFPDILVLSGFAFVIGSIFGVAVIIGKNKTMKSAVPFGPFIALASVVLFFFGEPLARAYFSLIS